MNKLVTLALLVSLPACGSPPARTETNTASSVEHSSEGGEIRRSSTETREVAQDGAETTDRTETTTTSTPPPN